MDWFKKHADTVVILGSFALCFWTVNEKINSLEKDVLIIKTILVTQKILPNELLANEGKK
jgi:hypothetical protein